MQETYEQPDDPTTDPTSVAPEDPASWEDPSQDPSQVAPDPVTPVPVEDPLEDPTEASSAEPAVDAPSALVETEPAPAASDEVAPDVPEGDTSDAAPDLPGAETESLDDGPSQPTDIPGDESADASPPAEVETVPSANTAVPAEASLDPSSELPPDDPGTGWWGPIESCCSTPQGDTGTQVSQGDSIAAVGPSGDPQLFEAVDSNGDGVPDMASMDANQDGQDDTWLYDTSGSGTANMLLIDTDGDGQPDVQLHDQGESGQWADPGQQFGLNQPPQYQEVFTNPSDQSIDEEYGLNQPEGTPTAYETLDGLVRTLETEKAKASPDPFVIGQLEQLIGFFTNNAAAQPWVRG
jgi:hypothetical protein